MWKMLSNSPVQLQSSYNAEKRQNKEKKEKVCRHCLTVSSKHKICSFYAIILQRPDGKEIVRKLKNQTHLQSDCICL